MRRMSSGRLAEDGVIPTQYQLWETDSAKYHVRTEQNVIDSDGTLVIYDHKLSGGTEFTRRIAIKHRKPHLLYDLRSPPEFSEVVAWLTENGIEVLNCAGPRESSCPGIQELARQLCLEIFSPCGDVESPH